MVHVRGILLAFVVAVVAVTTYVVLEPIPEDVDSPWMLKIISKFLILSPYGMKALPTGLVDWLDERFRAHSRASEPRVPYRDAVFDRVPVRIFADEPAGEKTDKRPAIVFYHGGGFVSSSVDMHHSLTAMLARELNAVVVSVDYRLAPKYPFPAAIDDCTAATVWFLKHIGDFNVDPGRVAIMGDSAGGNLAAATAQRLTFDPEYRDLPRPKLQVLIVPCLQAFDFHTPSYQQNGKYNTLILRRITMATYWNKYLLGNKGDVTEAMVINNHTSAAAKSSPLVQKCLSRDLIPDEFKRPDYRAPSTDFGDDALYEEIKDVLLDPDYAPLMREDLRGLPEAYILTAEYDVLRDDGIMYAKRLEKAGVPVTWKHYKTGFHALFGNLIPSEVGKQGDKDFLQFALKKL
ncbi:neutral cholesterol ester hydrolase 1-like [Patiria miniata]|uniref:Alpha/beta hydrolase fold-3 domain-containing protein n=1 Tax=Patiria miniata TaxID=46514 RepID=A0A913ZGR1_PATMI|nr:neutral cholesterol ester hydrolase 1-like [Patiria miniata]